MLSKVFRLSSLIPNGLVLCVKRRATVIVLRENKNTECINSGDDLKGSGNLEKLGSKSMCAPSHV